MSLETRSSSALFKRAEQLRRWEESETNREPVMVNGRTKKIKFSAGCVFLAACKAGERDEILRLIKKGADINTHDVDGLSALHQACIDDNLELVEFLVENGADVNKGDNEGWTPLHATASCGFLSIARYLIEKGANVAAVNNDGELPVDVSQSNAMEHMLKQELDDLGIDADKARNEEERLMLADAKNWMSSGYFGEKPHPKTGATALHVASAKGYLKVMDVLIKAGADINAQDLDGWTPLHAAAHWEQKEAAEVLAETHCDMGIKNCVGQTAFDVAENEMVRVLEDLRKKQATILRDNIERRPSKTISLNQRSVISDELESRGDRNSDKDDESENSSSDKVPPVHKVELEIHSPPKPSEYVATSNPHENQSSVDSDDDDDDDEVNSLSTETSDTGKSTDVSDDEESETEKKNRANKDESLRLPTMAVANKTVPNIQPQNKLNEVEDASSWRRPGSIRRLHDSVRPELTLRISDKDSPTGATPGTTVPSVRQQNAVRTEAPQEVSLRRTQSFEADKTYRHFLELRARVQAGNSCPALHSTPMRSASLKGRRLQTLQSRDESLRIAQSTPTTTATSPTSPSSAPTPTLPSSPVTTTSPVSTSPQATAQVRRLSNNSSVTPSTPTTPGGSKLSPANIFKNFFKSFVPPVRDEESETQRKAHAKRVRETRRSTQGVTLEEIKSAEQLVKKKQEQILQQASQQLGNSEPTDEVVVKVHTESPSAVEKPPAAQTGSEESVGGGTSPPVVSATLTRGNNQVVFTEERRPSWRLRVDNGSKFMLEDARKSDSNATSNNTHNVVRKTAVAIPVTETGDTTVTLPLRKARSDEKDEKESESRNAQATQAAIQRRRRPKRRSTGVVHVDMDEIDPDRQSDNSGGTSPSGDGDGVILNSKDGVISKNIIGLPSRSSPFSSFLFYIFSLIPGYNSSLSASSPYLNSSTYSTYGGTTSGYGGIYIPSSSTSLHNLSVPSISGLSSFSPLSRSPNTSQLPSRSSSFNRQRSRSRVRAVAGGGSVKRTLSEGYQSGSEASEPSSRLNSEPRSTYDSSPTERNSTENGEIDYKKLYEESQIENERLRGKLRRTEEELAETKETSEKNALLATRNSMSETEKRERRAMERKLSEMEEELKQLEQLKCENQRLKDENGALIRVISKLSK